MPNSPEIESGNMSPRVSCDRGAMGAVGVALVKRGRGVL